MISRRRFVGWLLAAPVVPYIANDIIISQPEIIAEADFGFTWGNVVAKEKTFTEIITTTLKSRSKEIADNLSHNNTLLLKLNEKQAIKINKISKETQMRRISDRVNHRRKKWDKDFHGVGRFETMQSTLERHKANTADKFGFNSIDFVVKEPNNV